MLDRADRSGAPDRTGLAGCAGPATCPPGVLVSLWITSADLTPESQMARACLARYKDYDHPLAIANCIDAVPPGRRPNGPVTVVTDRVVDLGFRVCGQRIEGHAEWFVPGARSWSPGLEKAPRT